MTSLRSSIPNNTRRWLHRVQSLCSNWRVTMRIVFWMWTKHCRRHTTFKSRLTTAIPLNRRDGLIGQKLTIRFLISSWTSAARACVMMNGTNRPVDRDEHYTQSGPAAGGRDDIGLEPKLLRIKNIYSCFQHTYIFMFSAPTISHYTCIYTYTLCFSLFGSIASDPTLAYESMCHCL